MFLMRLLVFRIVKYHLFLMVAHQFHLLHLLLQFLLIPSHQFGFSLVHSSCYLLCYIDFVITREELIQVGEEYLVHLRTSCLTFVLLGLSCSCFYIESVCNILCRISSLRYIQNCRRASWQTPSFPFQFFHSPFS